MADSEDIKLEISTNTLSAERFHGFSSAISENDILLKKENLQFGILWKLQTRATFNAEIPSAAYISKRAQDWDCETV